MSRILLVAASHFGRTRAIAERIAQRLREAGHRVDLVDANKDAWFTPPADYDAVVLGSRIELGRVAPEMVDFIRDHRLVLQDMPTAFFSVSMAASKGIQGVGRDASGYCAALFDKVGWTPTVFAAFAGGLPYRRYGWWMRAVMRAISKNAGHTTDTSRDHVFTDDTAVDRFADRLLVVLVPRREVVSHA